MIKKIVAIGGGENGRQLEDNSYTTYDTKSIDQEIIKLTGKDKPNFLFIDHAMSFSIDVQESYYQTMKKIYGGMFGCKCKDLKSTELDDIDIVKKKIAWADIIYEGGGDTKLMIELWKKSGFDNIMYDAWNKGKVIAGISAGAVCYFKLCNSDLSDNNHKEFEEVECLGWFNAFMTPHCNEEGRYESTKEQLYQNKLVGIMLSNKSAIEIVDNKYRILFDHNSESNLIKPFVLKSYWDNNEYKEKLLPESTKYDLLDNLFSKDID